MAIQQRVTEHEIQSAYQGLELAKRYVGDRFTSELTRLLHEKQVDLVQSYIDRTQPVRLLEIAPGPGRLTREIRAPKEHIVLEFNEGMIAAGRPLCAPKTQWIRGNAFALPFDPTASFDLVYTFRFVRHFKRPDRDRIYEQIHSCLAPGGWLVLDVVNAVASRPLRREAPEAYPIYDALYESLDVIRSELADAGFQLQEAVEVQRAIALQYKSQVLVGPRWNWLNRLIIRLLERWSRGPALEWIVTCRRE